MATRVLAPMPSNGRTEAMTEELILRRVRQALRDSDVDTVVIHKEGSHLRGPDGRDRVVGADGEPRLVGVAAAEGITSC